MGQVLSCEIEIRGVDVVNQNRRPCWPERYRRVRDQALRSRSPCARGEVLCAEPGRSRARPKCVVGPIPEGASRTKDMNVHEKSDTAIVPKKVSNKGGLPPAEGLEGRAVLKGNIQQPAAIWTQSQGVASIGLLDVRQAVQGGQPLCRFDAKHPREEPSALVAHAGICAGGAG